MTTIDEKTMEYTAEDYATALRQIEAGESWGGKADICLAALRIASTFGGGIEAAARVAEEYVADDSPCTDFDDATNKAFDSVIRTTIVVSKGIASQIRALRPAPAVAGEGWQTIESGPKENEPPWNGDPVLIYTDHNVGSRVHRAIWTDAIHGKGIYGWAVEDRKFGPYPLRGHMNVTHWRPLPAPPKDPT